jgi:hypothetical protein
MFIAFDHPNLPSSGRSEMWADHMSLPAELGL